MKRKILLFVLVAILISSCSKERAIIRREDKLIGVWEIEKVTYKRDFGLFARDITDEYAGDVLEFLPDFSAFYDDSSLGATFSGSWILLFEEDEYWSEDGNVSDLDFHLEANFYDYVTNEDFFFFGDIDRLTRNKLHFEMQDRRGEFRFKLRKI